MNVFSNIYVFLNSRIGLNLETDQCSRTLKSDFEMKSNLELVHSLIIFTKKKFVLKESTLIGLIPSSGSYESQIVCIFLNQIHMNIKIMSHSNYEIHSMNQMNHTITHK